MERLYSLRKRHWGLLLPSREHALNEPRLTGGLVFFGIFLTALVGLAQRRWKDDSDLPVWVLTVIWIYYFTTDQFLHSYFITIHFYLLTGVIASLRSKNHLELADTYVISVLQT